MDNLFCKVSFQAFSLLSFSTAFFDPVFILQCYTYNVCSVKLEFAYKCGIVFFVFFFFSQEQVPNLVCCFA